MYQLIGPSVFALRLPKHLTLRFAFRFYSGLWTRLTTPNNNFGEPRGYRQVLLNTTLFFFRKNGKYYQILI